MALDSNDLPQSFGPYTLLRRIAVGGMAEVYVAKTAGVAGFEKLAALKVIHPRFSEDEHFTQMLVEEAKIAVLLTHVNIAQTFDLGKIEDTYYIAMELIEGADTYRVMRRCAELKKAIPIDVATFIVAEMCSGLDYAHRKRDPNTGQALNIVHRDISPQNVLISFAGEVKIVDFGIAKAASRSTQTEVGVIKGKYYYMSPEQAWGDPMDHRSDVFSTGVCLYELLTGRMLYQDVEVPVLLDKVRKADIARPETRRPSIPRALSDIVMKALAKRPEDRWSSAGEMGQALHQFLYSVSPTFSAARLADLVSLLFPAEGARPGPVSPAAIDALPPQEPPPPAKPGFDLGDDDEDDATRNDVLPFKRKQQEAAQAQAALDAGPPVGATVRPPGRSDATREIPSADGRVSVPQIGPSGAWVAPVTSDPGLARRELTTDARTAPGHWEDQTDLRGDAAGAEDFEDSTLVDANLGRAAARAIASKEEPPTAERSTVDSPRGRVQVHAAGTRELSMKSSFADDHEDTTNELKRGGRALGALVPPRAAAPRAPAVQMPTPRAKLSDRPPARPQPQLPRPPGSMPMPPPSAAGRAEPRAHSQSLGGYGAPPNSPSVQGYAPVPYDTQQSATPGQGQGAQQGGYPPAQQAQPAYPSAQPVYPPAQPAYAPAQPAYAPAQPTYPLGQPGYPAAQQGYAPAPQTYPSSPHAAPGQAYPPASHPQGAGSQGYAGGSYQAAPPAADPFAPPPAVTGGLAALGLERARGFPWPLLVVGLLALAVLAGVGVYAFVPEPAPAFEISSLPPGATVSVNGAIAGTTPLAIRERLVVGQTYAFQVALEGHGTSTFEVAAVPGTLRREVVLSPLPATLRIETEPVGAQITVGGASRGASPQEVGGLYVGMEVEIRVDAPGYHPRTQREPIRAARNTLTIRLEPIR